MKQHPQRPLLVIVGPTAVGKTSLSLEAAKRFNGEIISADSRLFYRGMDIGTAKPSAAEMAQVPHHLIDICNPDETLSLGEYQELAYQKIDEILARGRLPMLVGGTGQYVKAVVEGWGIPRVAPQPELRRELEALGGPELARWLRLLDPITAERHDPRNVRRVIRALEVTLVKGVPISQLQTKRPPPYDIRVIGLGRDRATLHQRIDERVDQMIAAGLLGEVKALRKAGYGWELPAMSGLGYRQFQPYFEENVTLKEVIQRIKFETHRFLRQQKTWFQPDDPEIHWFDLEAADAAEKVIGFVESWLEFWLSSQPNLQQ